MTMKVIQCMSIEHIGHTLYDLMGHTMYDRVSHTLCAPYRPYAMKPTYGRKGHTLYDCIGHMQYDGIGHTAY